LADAEGCDLGEVLLDHEPVGRQICSIHPVEHGFQFCELEDDGLVATCGREGRLGARRPVLEQKGTRAACIVTGEGGKTRKDRALHTAPELVRPARGSGSVRLDQGMGDCLGPDEAVGHNATEQVLLALDPECRRSRAKKRVARDEIHRACVVGRRIVFSRERATFEGRELLGKLGLSHPYMGISASARIDRVDDHGPMQAM
jgi:hypothetical protein